MQVWRELKVTSAADVGTLAAQPQTRAEALALNGSWLLDQEKEICDVFPRNGVYLPMSLL